MDILCVGKLAPSVSFIYFFVFLNFQGLHCMPLILSNPTKVYSRIIESQKFVFANPKIIYCCR